MKLSMNRLTACKVALLNAVMQQLESIPSHGKEIVMTEYPHNGVDFGFYLADVPRQMKGLERSSYFSFEETAQLTDLNFQPYRIVNAMEDDKAYVTTPQNPIEGRFALGSESFTETAKQAAHHIVTYLIQP